MYFFMLTTIKIWITFSIYTLQALAGEIGMDTVLDDVSMSLFNGFLPNEWRKLAPATCKNLGDWMDHFLHRAIQYTTWVSPLLVSLLFGTTFCC